MAPEHDISYVKSDSDREERPIVDSFPNKEELPPMEIDVVVPGQGVSEEIGQLDPVETIRIGLNDLRTDSTQLENEFSEETNDILELWSNAKD